MWTSALRDIRSDVTAELIMVLGKDMSIPCPLVPLTMSFRVPWYTSDCIAGPAVWMVSSHGIPSTERAEAILVVTTCPGEQQLLMMIE